MGSRVREQDRNLHIYILHKSIKREPRGTNEVAMLMWDLEKVLEGSNKMMIDLDTNLG